MLAGGEEVRVDRRRVALPGLHRGEVTCELRLACLVVSDATPGFDAYGETYREAVERSIAFSGAELDFFTRAKVRVLARSHHPQGR